MKFIQSKNYTKILAELSDNESMHDLKASSKDSHHSDDERFNQDVLRYSHRELTSG